jgi:hypothetical protein
LNYLGLIVKTLNIKSCFDELIQGNSSINTSCKRVLDIIRPTVKIVCSDWGTRSGTSNLNKQTIPVRMVAML